MNQNSYSPQCSAHWKNNLYSFSPLSLSLTHTHHLPPPPQILLVGKIIQVLCSRFTFSNPSTKNMIETVIVKAPRPCPGRVRMVSYSESRTRKELPWSLMNLAYALLIDLFFFLMGKDMRKENKGTSCWVFQTTGQGPSTEVMRSIRWLSNSDFRYGNRIEQCQNDQNALQAVSINITLENVCFSFMWVLFIWWS